MTLIRTALALVLAAGFSAAAMAQDSHESHHPNDQSQATAPAAPSADASGNDTQSTGMMGQQGMTGGRGMPGGGGMMGGAGMMRMMMNMMGAAGMSEMARPGMDMANRVEGRIAFLKTEIKITDAQAKPWDAFAQALRDNAKELGDLRTKASAQTETPSLARRLDEQEQWYAARLDGIKEIKATLSPLYAALSDEQKKTADQLLPANIGLMPMMAMSMGMMSMAGPSGRGMSGRMMPGSKP